VSDLAVGATIVEINEEGEVAIEDGVYELEDGTQMKVEAGIITEIMEAEVEEEEVPEVEAPVEETFMDITLKDGGIVHIVTAIEGSFAAGDKMMLDGTEAGPGEYFTNDQRVIVVGEFGVIESVSEVAPEQTAEEREVQGVVNNLKELINQVKELKSQFEAEISEIKKENESLKERVQKFAAEPSEQKTETKVSFNKVNKEEKLKFFAKK
jgi:vacuolar-type H+-ATPase subunit I/STV1